MAIIKEESKAKGFIVTDHDYQSVLEVSSKNIFLHDGATNEIKSINELTDEFEEIFIV